MAIYNTQANKAMASKLNSKEFLFNLDLDNSSGKGFGTCNTALKLNIIEVHISSTLVIYTKA
jgi:hypothetical protein